MTTNINPSSTLAEPEEQASEPISEEERKLYTPEPRPRDYKEILLEKVVADDHPMRVGHVFTYTYKSLLQWEARDRANKQLVFLKEDPLHWKDITV